MPDVIGRIFESLKRVGEGLPLTGRMLVALVGSGMLGLLLWVVFSTNRPDMTTLFSQLDPTDGGAIVEELKGAKVPYRVVDNGTRILVPSGVVHETRLRLATKGLPQGGGVGFEIFDRSSLGVTDFVQRLNYQRALQGELARTIGQIKEVVQARVHLALPQPTIFTEAEKPVTASVVLHLRPGARLTTEQIRGIVHLVSSSVEGLNPDRVTVVDTLGKLLARPEEKGRSGSTTGQLEMQEAVESELAHRVQTMLTEILGPNKATVRVAAQIDFNSVERTEEWFDPRGVVKSEQRTSESQRSSTPSPSAVAGAASNIPGQSAPVSGAATTRTNKEAETIQYEVGKVFERKVVAPGQLRRVSVAVLIDGTYRMITDGKTAEQKAVYLPRKPEELEKIKEAVKKAVGFDISRGDQVEVAEFPFDTSIMDKERILMEEAERRALWFSTAKSAMTILGIVLVLLVGLRLLMRALKGHRLQEFPLQEALSMRKAERSLGVAATSAVDEIPDDPAKHGLRELARNKPNELAQLVRAWIVKSP